MHLRGVSAESIPAEQLGAPRNIAETGESLLLSWIVFGRYQSELFEERVPEARSCNRKGSVSESKAFLASGTASSGPLLRDLRLRVGTWRSSMQLSDVSGGLSMKGFVYNNNNNNNNNFITQWNTWERVLAKRCNKLRVYSQTYRTDMYLNNRSRRKGLHDSNSLREEAKPKPASLGLNGPVAPTGGKKLEQVVGWVRRVNRNFTGSVTQPSVIKRCNRWKFATGYTGGLPYNTL